MIEAGSNRPSASGSAHQTDLKCLYRARRRVEWGRFVAHPTPSIFCEVPSMRLRLIVSLLVLCGSALPLHAQRTAPAESVSHEMIKDVLKNLDCKWSVEEWKYSVELKNRKFMVYRLDNGKRLLLKASIKERPALETINRFNEQTAATTRAVRYERLGTILEAGVDCQLGITAAGLKKILMRLVGDLARF